MKLILQMSMVAPGIRVRVLHFVILRVWNLLLIHPGPVDVCRLGLFYNGSVCDAPDAAEQAT